MAEEPRKPREFEVAPWVILVTFFIGWGLGGGLIAYNALSRTNNLAAFGIGVWLICLPLVATRPLEILRRLLG